MSETKTAVEMIVADAVGKVVEQANQVIGELVDRINSDPTLPDLPSVELRPPEIVLAPPPADVKADALSRAGRSFVGGLITTVLATVGTEIGKVVTSGAFDPLDGSAWKTAAVGLAGSLGYAAVAYVQRFISAPGTQR